MGGLSEDRVVRDVGCDLQQPGGHSVVSRWCSSLEDKGELFQAQGLETDTSSPTEKVAVGPGPAVGSWALGALGEEAEAVSLMPCQGLGSWA